MLILDFLKRIIYPEIRNVGIDKHQDKTYLKDNTNGKALHVWCLTGNGTLVDQTIPLNAYRSNGRISAEAFKNFENYKVKKLMFIEEEAEKVKLTNIAYRIGADFFVLEKCKDERPAFTQVLESAYRFVLGSFGGVIGASSVYPVDYVKTHVQNTRRSTIGGIAQDVAYDGYLDCFRKTVQRHGFLGLYRGLIPQILGVAPEKAIKLTTHGFVRDRLLLLDVFENKIFCDVIGGMCSGCAQVIVTNPLEIIKVRLQTSESEGKKIRARNVIRQLGFRGLYFGSRTCMMRDIPFSGIYFPTYAFLKSKLVNENGSNPPWTLLASGISAGIPAAALVTPFDVIKTRLQVIPKPDDTVYNGVIDCGKKIVQEEGFKAIWKGTIARICRTAPQFGITLFMYETLQRFLYIDFENKAYDPKKGTR